ELLLYLFSPLVFQIGAHLYNGYISRYKFRSINIEIESFLIHRWDKDCAPVRLHYSEVTREFVNNDIEFYTKIGHKPIGFIGYNTINPHDMKLLNELLDDRFEPYEAD
ncbi:MAG: hypothetical protein HYV28_19240, partial [Ignavibacteriales bacterium]|nr:hypothetical protein [Ignavibacteriales bacterium]